MTNFEGNTTLSEQKGKGFITATSKSSGHAVL